VNEDAGEVEPIGRVTDYFWKRERVGIEVARGSIREGDSLHVRGEFTDRTIRAADMEIDGEPVDVVEEGERFFMPLDNQKRVVLGDRVYPAD